MEHFLSWNDAEDQRLDKEQFVNQLKFEGYEYSFVNELVKYCKVHFLLNYI